MSRGVGGVHYEPDWMTSVNRSLRETKRNIGMIDHAGSVDEGFGRAPTNRYLMRSESINIPYIMFNAWYGV
jgi:hypothetical protein